MATAFATGRSAATTTLGEGVNDISARRLSVPALRSGSMTQSGCSSIQSTPRISLPPPNPPFVFPARPSTSSSSSPYSKGRRPLSAVEFPGRTLQLTDDLSLAPPEFSFNPGASLSPDAATRSRRPSALPDFSFNPGANPGATLGPDESLLSPPLSPPSPMMTPSRTGHRRGGSEFVGGKLKAGGSITVMSTSPTRSESGFDSPKPSPKLSPADAHPRRGHAHRRSGAISSHDLTLILKPNTSPALRGNSAPPTPADFDDKHRSLPEPSIEASKNEPDPKEAKEEEEEVQETHSQSTPTPSPSPKTAARGRVGFSDTLEFIPRPLSLVSTDTSSTMTVRPNHRVSGSMSSIVSTNLAIGDREQAIRMGSPSSRTMNDSRPSTAGAVLERTPSLHVLNGDPLSPRRRNSIPLLANLPQGISGSSANSSPTKTPRRWSFFGLEPFAGTNSPTKARLLGSSLSEFTERDSSLAKLTGKTGRKHVSDDTISRTDSKKASGRKKKQKKVKSWAGSILTRKSKSRSHKSKSIRRRSQTPPLHMTHGIEGIEDGLLQTSIALPPPTVLVTEPAPTESDTVTTHLSQAYDEDPSYPMIDLDAALGPFNTPSSRDMQWEEAQKAGAAPKRQLHSAAGLRGFSGPGMHYHRRTESAPEMAPFENARFGIHRFGSSSTMADVFEEDEEDEEDLSTNTPSETSSSEAQDDSFNESDSASIIDDDAASTPTQEHEPGKDGQQTFPSVKRKGSGSSLEMQRPGSKMKTENSASGLHEEVIAEEPNFVISGREYNFPVSSDASDSNTPSPRRMYSDDVDPLEMNAATPAPSTVPTTPYSMSYSPSFPSPRSLMSYDAHRISTTPSIADENSYHSLLMGEPGPELVRISVEVPSLTSSNSTMTRDSTFMPGVQPRNMPFHDQRPASFTSTPFGRRRSSLISLSRLISSAHAERSKLSMEVSLDSEPEKKSKVSKSKRLSRMMQFWKPKGSTES